MIIPFIYTLFANASMVIFTKKSFGKVLPLTFIINILILFVSGVLFNNLTVGFIINLLFGLYSVYYLIKNKDKKEFKNNYFSNGFYVFIMLFILICIFDYNRSFSHWDEFSHWGEMIKEMFRLDKLYTVKESVLQAHKDYPPGISLFEFFWCKLTGVYSEATLIKSLHIFEFSLFIPALFEKKKFKNIFSLIFRSVISLILIYVLISLFDQHGVINSIYTDYIMAIILAYAIFSVIFEKDLLSNFFIFELTLMLILMMLTKQMGLPFCMMIMLVYLVKLIYEKKFNMNNKKELIKVFIFTIFLPILIWKGWDMYVSSMYSLQQFKLSDIKMSELLGIIRGTKGEGYQITTAYNFINALKNINITSCDLTFTYIESIILMVIIMYIVYIYGKKSIDKKDFINMETIMILGSVGYAFIMLVLYVFNFGEIEGPNLASYNRYMDTYVIFCISLIFMVFIRIYSQNYKNKKIDCLTIVTLLSILLISSSLIDTYKPVFNKSPHSPYQIAASKINKYTKKGKVYVIAQDSVGDYQYFTKYYANPIVVNLKDFNLKKENVTDKYKQKIKDKILKYDYLYLAVIDDKFKENYEELFDGQKIESGCMYKIKDDKILLKGC